jgi:hypothetical protein
MMNVGVISNTIGNRAFGNYDDPLSNSNVDNIIASTPILKRNLSPLQKKKKKKVKSAKKFIPKAGSTSVKIENATDLAVDKNGNAVAGWREVDPLTVQVRGIGYSSWKKNKIESPGDLYRCVKSDVFESPHRYPDMANRVRLPRVKFEDEDGVVDQQKTWVSPDTFVISVALPTDLSKKSESDDGEGYTITMYYAMQQETRDILKRITADDYDPNSEEKSDNRSKVNAVRLLEKWCREAPNDDKMMSRFKVLPRVENLGEIGLPSWISKMNGKPFLVKRPGKTGFLYSHPKRSCMEFDLNLHPFPYLAKKAICCMKETYFKKMVATLAFCLEGRDEDELPECLLGAFQLCYPDPVHAIQGEEFFAGKGQN